MTSRRWRANQEPTGWMKRKAKLATWSRPPAAPWSLADALVGPLPAFDEFGVGPLRHKNVGEHLVVHASGAVAHAQAGRQEDPFAEVLWREQMIVAGILRLA